MQYISFSFPNLPQVCCVFQTREQGCSSGCWACGNIAFNVGDQPEHVLENRRQLLQVLGLAAWSEVNQVHGDRLLTDAEPVLLHAGSGLPSGDNSEADRGGVHALEDADGLATTRPGLALLIKTADCQPVLLASRQGQHIAALHVGWKGNRIGFIGRAVKEFCCCYGLDPADLLAVRGPSLGPANSEFINFQAEWGPEFLPWLNQADMCMDLWRLTHCQLLEAGLAEQNIFSIDLCTHAHPELFFSFRRDKGLTGRQASLIWIAG